MLLNKYEIKRRALLEAIRFAGSVAKLAKHIGAQRSQVNNWLNRDDAIPYQYAILIEEISGVSIERLAPNEVAANKVIRQLRNVTDEQIVDIAISKIQISTPTQVQMHPSEAKTRELSRPIIVGSDMTLISGSDRLAAHKALGHTTVPAIIVDIEALVLGERLITEYQEPISISDQVAVAMQIENKLGNRQGRRSDLQDNKEKSCKPSDSLDQTSNPLRGRTDDLASKLAGFSSRESYRRAKNVVQQGTPELITAMDNKSISISLAANLATTPHEQQLDFLRERQT